jgi:outer membrane lipoprotein SlyB
MNMNVQKITAVLLVGASVVLSGCTRNISSKNYNSANVGEAANTYQGIIVNVENVNVSETEKLSENGMGMGLGAVGGGLLGSAFGKGTGQLVGMGVGALAGGVGGAFAEQALGNQDGIKYTVKLSNGQIKTVVQGNDNPMQVGQRVFLEESSGRNKGRSRVYPDNTPVMEVQQMQPLPASPAVVVFR